MASYNLKFNKDDSVVRHVVVGLLADLNSKLSFWRQINHDERVIVDVPFYYAIAGDENFMRDNFLFSTLNGENCDPDPIKADGNYDRVPRGIVNLTSIAIDPSKLVNKRNLGQYNMITPNGEFKGFVAEFEMIPVNLGVDIEIILSSQLDMFKVTEAIIKKMYKANFYNVDAGHLDEGTYRISSEYMMPEDYTQERPVEYGFDDKQNHKVTFSLEINSFIHSFDFEEDIYTKFIRRDYSDNSAITSNYGDPNKYISGIVIPDTDSGSGEEPTSPGTGNLYYDADGSVWQWDGEDTWVQTATNYTPTEEDLPGLYEESVSLIRTSRRRPNDNRIFTMGNSKVNKPGTTEDDKTLLGDDYNVTGRELPFNE